MGGSNEFGWFDSLSLLFFALIALLMLGSSGRLHLGFYNPYFLPPLKRHYKKILNKYFSFHKSLPPKSRRTFEKRVQYFIHQKSFISRSKGKSVSDAQKVLIAAAAIQITFGLPRVYLKHFNKILIYPNSYYSNITKKYHKGEVNPRVGAIVFSWKNFLHGQSDLKDGINLGLHEMAHALMLENLIMNGEHGFISSESLSTWNYIVGLEKGRIFDSPLFRDYALSHESELFPVTVELFFEKPHELKVFSKELYESISVLLNQDPH